MSEQLYPPTAYNMQYPPTAHCDAVAAQLGIAYSTQYPPAAYVTSKVALGSTADVAGLYGHYEVYPQKEDRP